MAQFKMIGIAAVAALGFAFPAAASQIILLSDNFDSEAARLGERVSLQNWGVTGEIDVVDEVNPFGIVCSGRCIDLNGSAGIGSINVTPVPIAAGRRVTVTFQLTGNQRNNDINEFILNAGELGTQASWRDFTYIIDQELISNNLNTFRNNVGGTPSVYMNIFIPGSDRLRTYGFSFVPSESVVLQLNMASLSDTSTGPVLDNFLITQAAGAVPEPTSWAMLIAGFGLTGGFMRNRRRRPLVAG